MSIAPKCQTGSSIVAHNCLYLSSPPSAHAQEYRISTPACAQQYWIGPGDRKQIAAVAGPSDIRIVERHSGRGMACGLSSGEKGGTLAINVNWCLIIIRGDNEVNISLAKIKTCFA